MRWLAKILGAALTASVCGCRSNCSRVESELAARESDVRVLKDELSQAEGMNTSLIRELQAIRGQPGPFGIIERPTVPYPVKNIALGSLTGGVPSDTLPGDDALQVLVEVRDHENQPLKVPGVAVVEAIGITPEGLKTPLCSWDIPVEELRGKWQQGLFNTGYLLTFPWKVWPTTEKVRVQVRFTLLDGRAFETEKTVSVRLIPETQRRPINQGVSPTLTPSLPLPILPNPQPSPSSGINRNNTPTVTQTQPPATILRPLPWKAD